MKPLHSNMGKVFLFCVGVMLVQACSKDDDLCLGDSVHTTIHDTLDVYQDSALYEITAESDSIPESFLENLNREEFADIEDPCDVILPHGARACDYVRYQGSSYTAYESMIVGRMMARSGKKSTKSGDPYSGLSSHAVWHALMADMTIGARALTQQSNYSFPYEGPMSPAHTGIAYVYGGKDFSQRSNATAWGGCAYNLYGLDCSGFLQHVFHAGDIDFPEGPAVHQGSAQTIQNALSIYGSTSTLSVQNIGKVDPSEMIAGDIIYWNQLSGSSASHIGFIGERIGGGLVVYQSNGSRATNCEANYGSSRGARAFDLSSNYWFGGTAHWHIVRITPGGISWNPCVNLTATSAWSPSNSAFPSDNHVQLYEVFPEGGVSPYQYSFNMGAFQSSNELITGLVGPHMCTVRDAQGCEHTIAL